MRISPVTMGSVNATLLLFVLSGVVLAGGQTSRQIGAPKQTTSPLAEMLVSPAAARAISIGPGDLVDVAVFDTAELTGKIRVGEDGNVSMPLIGSLHVAGLTTDDTSALVRKKLVEGDFVKDPQVSVFVEEFAQGVTVSGEVNKPGIYPVMGGKSLQDAISLASGLSPFAGSIATITRRGTADSVTMAIRGENGELRVPHVELFPGDTVQVERAGIVYVLGDVGKAGGFVMDKQSMTVLQALAMAQGATKTAALNKALLIHTEGSEVREIQLRLKLIVTLKSPDPILQAGDIIYVPTSGLRNAMQVSLPNILASTIGASIYKF